jgi:hypothetical protein
MYEVEITLLSPQAVVAAFEVVHEASICVCRGGGFETLFGVSYCSADRFSENDDSGRTTNLSDGPL